MGRREDELDPSVVVRAGSVKATLGSALPSCELHNRKRVAHGESAVRVHIVADERHVGAANAPGRGAENDKQRAGDGDGDEVTKDHVGLLAKSIPRDSESV